MFISITKFDRVLKVCNVPIMQHINESTGKRTTDVKKDIIIMCTTLLIIFLASITRATCLERNSIFKVQYGQIVSDQAAIVKSRSKIECAIFCRLNCACNSFVFDKVTLTCQLKPQVTPGLGNNTLNVYTRTVNQPANCKDVLTYDRKSGIHTLYLPNLKSVTVFCDQSTDNGGWTVIQRRQDGSVNFSREWAQYEMGFGNLNTEFWIGLANLYDLTNSRSCNQTNVTLRIDLMDFNGNTAYAVYDTFYIMNSSNYYRLVIDGYHGNAGDGMTISNTANFSTPDMDNEDCFYNCGQMCGGGWWYYHCHEEALPPTNLNGLYGANGLQGVFLFPWREYEPLKWVEMKIRY